MTANLLYQSRISLPGCQKKSRLCRELFAKVKYAASGADGGCIFKYHTSSTTIIGIRRYEVDPSKSGKSYVWQIWIVIAGPSELVHLEWIMRLRMLFLVKHDPGADIQCFESTHAACANTEVNHSQWCLLPGRCQQGGEVQNHTHSPLLRMGRTRQTTTLVGARFHGGRLHDDVQTDANVTAKRHQRLHTNRHLPWRSHEVQSYLLSAHCWSVHVIKCMEREAVLWIFQGV